MIDTVMFGIQIFSITGVCYIYYKQDEDDKE